MTFTSTLLAQDNSVQEIQKADLDLLNKINQIAASTSVTSTSTTSTTTATTSKARLISKHSYTGNGVMLPDGDVITFGQATGAGSCALFNGQPIADSSYRSPFLLQKPAGETGELVTIDMWAHGGCALYSSGNFYTAGYNARGGLGLGNTTSQPMLTLSSTDVIEYVRPKNINYEHNVWRLWIKKTDGLWYVAGSNSDGQCGTGDTADKLLWTHPTSMGTDVAKIWNLGTGGGITVIRKTNGSVWAAGYNTYGQFGLGNTTQYNSFVDITSAWGILPTDTLDVFGEFGWADTGGYYRGFLLMLINGTVKSCGCNDFGALGDGTLTSKSIPVNPIGLPTNISKLITNGGTGSVYALTTTNDLYVWGYNSTGQLGVNSTTTISTPTKITTIPKTITDVFADAHGNTWQYVNCAFVQCETGEIYVAGSNLNGQCGNGTYNQLNAWTMIPFDTKRYGKIVDMSWNGYGNGGFYIMALTDTDRFFGVGYNGRQGLSLTGEALNKSVFTEMKF